jgi:GxxExxY protein
VTDIEVTARFVVDAAVQVHRALGPGLLASADQKCSTYELLRQNRLVEGEVVLPVIYAGYQIDAGYRRDMCVDRCVIVENKGR